MAGWRTVAKSAKFPNAGVDLQDGQKSDGKASYLSFVSFY